MFKLILPICYTNFDVRILRHGRLETILVVLLMFSLTGPCVTQASIPNPDRDDGQYYLQEGDVALAATEVSNLGNRLLVPSLTIDPQTFDEASDVGWQLYFDNDLFSGSKEDRDYTGGFALAYSGRRARDWWFSLDPWLNRIDDLTGIHKRKSAATGFLRHTIEFGLVLLTPDNLTTESPQVNDRPFANFLFMSNSQQMTSPNKNLILQSALTVGLVGTKVGPTIQSTIHSAIGGEQANGWGNQISNGGELTGKYSVMAQKNLVRRYNRFSYEFSGAVEGNVGFNTDIAVSLTTRFGQLKSPWWSFTPYQSDYINLGQARTSQINKKIMPAEIFGWAGVKAKYSIYNGFLQGQFRHSEVRIGSSELKRGVFEAWLGATSSWRNGIGLSFFIRKRTAEINRSYSRDALWSGFILSFTSKG